MRRILFAAPKSGSGKTLITCGFLEALKRRGLHPAAFKCGPDYIDPMFHQYVMGIPGGNLDTFFLGKEEVRQLFIKQMEDTAADFAVLEGVMGYYDGIGAVSSEGSTFDIAAATETPAVLIIDCKGASVSLAALVKGFLAYKEESRIQGVILNRLPPGLYGRIKPVIEQEGVPVYGYLPEMKDCVIESRHLGLMLPGEIKDLRKKIERTAQQIERSIDMEGLLLAAEGKELKAGKSIWPAPVPPVNIAVARDEAFCFYYQENLKLMEQLGAKLEFFSPLRDKKLPEADGYLFGGGYPENFAGELSENKTMLESVRQADRKGKMILAECGGFLYLHRLLEGADGKFYEMAGLVDAKAFRTDRLSRFGYIELEGPSGEKIKGHEFHYWDTELTEGAWTARKPLSDRNWRCMVQTDHLLCGFPHLYYPSGPEWLRDWLIKAGRK
ncbi:hydrogenobyrinic acid a,c-diamide synthase (glutamine-hydrolysing) /cobyrinate a,c-diamide synthase [[Clostridium] cf. saccharolyticum K10]|uniref:cobyrinate a,c-diamide synthase n=1 Tax=Clostridium sp. AM29-11AC TaxID=2293028 RepID=UPI0001CCD8FD|nr:cobyrinate a,c-diamide synthase [Clostridium sp. AM29-11AC]CBK77804.1 hydrogenobyrinic acid a,c-diamide synthase (glutamine-hydrolysing) /cobyrinate a,c-diamide synthase [[Clostridium] cf. saccharolyticum K10]